MLYNLALQRGLGANRAREFAAAAAAESSLNPRATNSSSGAAGLFQLLSSGYRQKAQSLGGLYNPRANALAILPDYVNYWKQHPNAVPGAGGAAVERSGQGAGFYAKPLGSLGYLGRGSAPTPTLPGVPAPQQPTVRPKATGGRTVDLLPLLKILGLGDLPGISELAKFRTPGQPAQPRAAKIKKQPQVVVSANVKPDATTLGIVKAAKQYLGTPYEWGGASPKGFDCSGFVQWLYKQRGVTLPRTTYQQIKVGTPIGMGQLQPGDIVFFSKKGDVHHEGLYIGNGQFIHAPHTGDVVKISSLSEPYYQKQFAGGRRVA